MTALEEKGKRCSVTKCRFGMKKVFNGLRLFFADHFFECVFHGSGKRLRLTQA